MRCLTLLFSLSALLLFLTSPVKAERGQVRGTVVIIEFADGFEESEEFSGLIWQEASASILVTEMPAEAFQEVRDGVLRDTRALSEKGIVLEHIHDLTVDSHPAVLGRGHQQLDTQKFEKWMLLVGTPQTTLFLTAQMPSATATQEQIDRMDMVIASVGIADARTDPRLALPFVFEETERMRFVQTLSGSVALLTSSDAGSSTQSPLFIIAASLGQNCAILAKIFEQMADQAIHSIAQLQDVADVQHRPTQIGGDPALVSSAAAVQDGVAVLVVQTMRVRDCRYLRTIGIVPQQEAKLYRDEFEQLAGTVQWREPADN